MKKIFQILLLVVLNGSSIKLLAQQQKAQNSYSKTSIAEHFSVSIQRAAQIEAALNLNKNELIKAINNKRLHTDRKQALIKQLLAQRQAAIDATLTVPELQKLRILQADGIKRAKVRREQFEKRHQEEMSQPVKGGKVISEPKNKY